MFSKKYTLIFFYFYFFYTVLFFLFLYEKFPFGCTNFEMCLNRNKQIKKNSSQVFGNSVKTTQNIRKQLKKKNGMTERKKRWKALTMWAMLNGKMRNWTSPIVPQRQLQIKTRRICRNKILLFWFLRFYKRKICKYYGR